MKGMSVLDCVPSGYLGVPCAHCGRKDRVMGIVSRVNAAGVRQKVYLCHALPDGRKAEPDCYHLVTVYGERLGKRKADGGEIQR